MDQTDSQLGGPTSDAGTVATDRDTEVFDWTFAAPGTYYLLMESNGDEAPGSPSYAVAYSVVPRGEGGSGPPSAPLIGSLRLPSPQRGYAVKGTVVLGRSVSSLRVELRASGKTIARLTRGPLAAGAHPFRLALSRGWRRLVRRRHRLRFEIVVIARATGTAAGLAEHVTLLR